MRQKEQSLNSPADGLIATWKEPDEVADMARTYQWLNKSNIRANTEALVMAAQEQVLNTRAVATGYWGLLAIIVISAELSHP